MTPPSLTFFDGIGNDRACRCCCCCRCFEGLDDPAPICSSFLLTAAAATRGLFVATALLAADEKRLVVAVRAGMPMPTARAAAAAPPGNVWVGFASLLSLYLAWAWSGKSWRERSGRLSDGSAGTLTREIYLPALKTLCENFTPNFFGKENYLESLRELAVFAVRKGSKGLSKLYRPSPFSGVHIHSYQCLIGVAECGLRRLSWGPVRSRSGS